MLVRSSTAIAAICILSGAAFAQGAAKPTDPQIAHIAYTAGQLDIEAAKQALSKSTNRDVRALAEGMVGDHNKEALDLVTKLKVTPEDNDISRALSKAAADKRAELAKLSGADSRLKRRSFRPPAIPNLRACLRPVSRFFKAMSSTPNRLLLH